MVCVWVCVQNVTKRVRVWEKRATLAFFWRRGRCASAGAQQTAGWRWRCGHRPHSLCDVLWHTDGSWHNTDRLSLRPLAPTLTPPPSSPLQNGCSLSCWRSTRFYLSPDLIDIQIDAKDIVATLLFPVFFHFLLPTPPLSSVTSPIPFFVILVHAAILPRCERESVFGWDSCKYAKKQDVTVEWFQMNIHSHYQQLPLSKTANMHLTCAAEFALKMKGQQTIWIAPFFPPPLTTIL